ncbi:MAG: aminotransferase class I/II-fold pyridoxal phosphate-dependent enzyme, partial [Gammaproteobacteria bacterium]|nr:aminotransferase class I/II-fold pyridoxal phosphate-dependent enzyme [Gammaproteobacteria bacterium]
NWYPEPRPVALQHTLAAHYGVDAEQLLVTRGSSEAIDLLIRGFCRAGEDAVVIAPPTFGMYEVYAQLQGAAVRVVPLQRERGYALDVAGIAEGWRETDRIAFVCSPNNPTGNLLADSDLVELAEALQGRGCVALDAAYAEFAERDQTRMLLDRFDNVVVLRTLSKAMALAGVRCGVLLGPAAIVSLLGCILPPYSFPAPCAEAVARCLEPDNKSEWRRRVQLIRSERERLAAAIAPLPGIIRIWPSSANFILVELRDPARFVARARAAGILLRDFSWDPYLPGCVRITIGTPSQNDQLLNAVS